MKLSIIIPVFNEEKTISQVLDAVFKIKIQESISKEIIVINDCSTDNTGKILKNYIKKGIIYKRHEKNSGKGAAIKTGLLSATGQFVIIQDADLEYNPIFYKKLLSYVLEKKNQVVYGSRLINYPLKLWGKNKTVLPTHLLANKFLTFMTNILYGGNLTDMETGYKLFLKKILDQLNLKSNGFDFEAEVSAKILKNKIPIKEVAISVTPRTYQEGKKIGWQDGIIAVWTLIKYKFVD